MQYENIVNIYGYICSKKQQGAFVYELMDKFNVKISDIKSFIKVLDLFYEEIHYEIINENIDEFNINRKSKIVIEGYSYYLKDKYDYYISNNISQILDRYSYDNKIIDIVGNRLNFKYINKSSTLKDKFIEVKEIKRELIDVIIKNNYINIVFYNNNEISRLHKVYVLGMYFDEILKEYLVILNNYIEISLNNIKDIECLNEKVKFNIKFDVNMYLKNKCNKILKLKVYDEANVIEKVNFIFRNNEKKIIPEKEYYYYIIKVDNPYKYKDLINNFGMSVIVDEPLSLKNDIIFETKKTIKALKNK